MISILFLTAKHFFPHIKSPVEPQYPKLMGVEVCLLKLAGAGDPHVVSPSAS